MTLNSKIARLYGGSIVTIRQNNTKEPVIVKPVMTNMGDPMLPPRPRLRPLSSLTEEEARYLYKLHHGVEWEPRPDWLPDHHPDLSCIDQWWQEDAEFYIPRHSLYIGEPDIWLELIDMGFDLFGLIEAGEAVDVTKVK